MGVGGGPHLLCKFCRSTGDDDGKGCAGERGRGVTYCGSPVVVLVTAREGGGGGVISCCRNPLILSVTWRGGDGGGGARHLP